MNFDPKDNDLAKLLQDYAAPVEDNGFSEAVLRRVSREQALRNWGLGGACLLAGLIIALPLKNAAEKIAASLSGDRENAIDVQSALPDLSAALPAAESFTLPYGIPVWTLGVVVLLAFWLLSEAVESFA